MTDGEATMATISRSSEAEAFLATIQQADADAVSACHGWTTHEIAAHVTGIAVEVIRHLDPYLQGEPVPKTRGFEEREASLQALDHRTLLDRLDTEEQRMRAVVAAVLDREPEAVIPWTGRHMAVSKFIPHVRNEHALHRWDVAGDDDKSNELLGEPSLVEHSVGELGQILVRAGRSHDPSPDKEFAVRLRCPEQRDLRVVVEGGMAGLLWADDDADEPAVQTDAAARHLLIWGRRPDRRGRIHSRIGPLELTRLQKLLSGY
jgi:hypothetical protein